MLVGGSLVGVITVAVGVTIIVAMIGGWEVGVVAKAASRGSRM